MFMRLQQFDVCNEASAPMAAAADYMLPTHANLPGLLIIPTHNGVVLIA